MYGVYVCVWAHVKMATKTGDITPGLSIRGRGGEGPGNKMGTHVCICVSMYGGGVHV